MKSQKNYVLNFEIRYLGFTILGLILRFLNMFENHVFFLNETEQNLILAKFGWSRVSQNCSHFLTSRYVTKILTYTYLRIPKDSHVTTLGIWL